MNVFHPNFDLFKIGLFFVSRLLKSNNKIRVKILLFLLRFTYRKAFFCDVEKQLSYKTDFREGIGQFSLEIISFRAQKWQLKSSNVAFIFSYPYITATCRGSSTLRIQVMLLIRRHITLQSELIVQICME